MWESVCVWIYIYLNLAEVWTLYWYCLKNIRKNDIDGCVQLCMPTEHSFSCGLVSSVDYLPDLICFMSWRLKFWGLILGKWMFQLWGVMLALQFYLFFPRFGKLCSNWFDLVRGILVEILFDLSYVIQVKPPCSFTPEETEYLTSRIQNGGTEVVEVRWNWRLVKLVFLFIKVKFCCAWLAPLLFYLS